jgi:AraC-like DNA-binding protein
MTQLAHRLDYYDQAHFIKDFKAFSGITPKEYFQQKNICFAEF